MHLALRALQKHIEDPENTQAGRPRSSTKRYRLLSFSFCGFRFSVKCIAGLRYVGKRIAT